jgi:hypothetical protein
MDIRPNGRPGAKQLVAKHTAHPIVLDGPKDLDHAQ